jgi:hypothetical protein
MNTQTAARYECGYCGGVARWEQTVGSYVHADQGPRIGTVSPGDHVSARHNRAGTPILPCDLEEAESVTVSR